MPQEVIDCVNQLAQADAQPELLTFYDRKGRLIGDQDNLEETDENNNPPPDEDGLEDLNSPEVNYNYGIDDEQDVDPPFVEDQHHDDNPPPTDDLNIPEELPPQVLQDELETITPIPEPQEPDSGVTPLRQSTRTRHKPTRLVPVFGRKSYESTAATTIRLIHQDEYLDQHYILIAHYIKTQYSMKAGMKKFKERGKEAVSKELSQLHYQDTFEPLHSKSLTFQEHLEVLESHLFLKEKGDESIKGQMVAGGNKQRGTIEKLDASSPTATLESVLLTSGIDAKEH
jgi:hypothetical protein